MVNKTDYEDVKTVCQNHLLVIGFGMLEVMCSSITFFCIVQISSHHVYRPTSAPILELC